MRRPIPDIKRANTHAHRERETPELLPLSTVCTNALSSSSLPSTWHGHSRSLLDFEFGVKSSSFFFFFFLPWRVLSSVLVFSTALSPSLGVFFFGALCVCLCVCAPSVLLPATHSHSHSLTHARVVSLFFFSPRADAPCLGHDHCVRWRGTARSTSSTRRIISAASDAYVTTDDLTLNDSVMRSFATSAMSPLKTSRPIVLLLE